MGIVARWNLGAKALEVARWASDIARNLDPAAVLGLVFKVIEIERGMRGIPGADKLRALLDWVRANYPGYAGNASVANFVSALVALLNALAIFRK